MKRKVPVELAAPPDSEGETVKFKATRIAVLAVLTIQNCSLMMVTSYSLSLSGPKYITSTAVFTGEVVKTAIVFGVLIAQNGVSEGFHVIWNAKETTKFAVPAFFYTIQNNLWYYAMACLDPLTAAVTSQGKVLSTALFSMVMLQKQLNRIHWSALLVLVFGLVVMQLQEAGGSDETHHVHLDEPSPVVGRPKQLKPQLSATSISEHSYYFGLLCMVASCTSSGYAGVYLERLFKHLEDNIWLSNMQLQLFCMPIATIPMFFDMDDLLADGFLYGWDRVTLVMVLLNALGGFVVSLTMKYADNILKTFAVSMSLVVNCLLSRVLMSVTLTQHSIAGVMLVIVASWLYSAGNSSMRHDVGYQLAGRGSKDDGNYISEMTDCPTDATFARHSPHSTEPSRIGMPTRIGMDSIQAVAV